MISLISGIQAGPCCWSVKCGLTIKHEDQLGSWWFMVTAMQLYIDYTMTWHYIAMCHQTCCGWSQGQCNHLYQTSPPFGDWGRYTHYHPQRYAGTWPWFPNKPCDSPLFCARVRMFQVWSVWSVWSVGSWKMHFHCMAQIWELVSAMLLVLRRKKFLGAQPLSWWPLMLSEAPHWRTPLYHAVNHARTAPDVAIFGISIPKDPICGFLICHGTTLGTLGPMGVLILNS